MNEMDEAIRSAKLKREERNELQQIYPNLYDLDLPYSIQCADVKNLEICRNAFTRYCPTYFVIDNVRFEKHRTYPVCRWYVEYVPENGDLPEQGDALKTLVGLILQQQPDNCQVLDRGLVEKRKVVVYCGVISCKCPAPVFEDTDIKSPLYLLENLRL